MRQRLIDLGLVVLLGPTIGLTGCRLPVGALSSLGRAGAIGARGAASAGSGMARLGGMAGRTVPRVGAAGIKTVIPRAVPSVPRPPLGGAAGFDAALGSRVARSVGPLTTEEAAVATQLGLPRSGAAHPFESLSPQFRRAGDAGRATSTASPRPLPGVAGRVAHPLPPEESSAQARMQPGGERDSLGSHASHVGSHMIHLPHNDRNRDRDQSKGP